MKYICDTCNKGMTLKTMYLKHMCLECNNRYHRKYREKNRERVNEYTREYRKTQRWLNGTDNWDDLGPDIPVGLKSINGVLKVSVK